MYDHATRNTGIGIRFALWHGKEAKKATKR